MKKSVPALILIFLIPLFLSAQKRNRYKYEAIFAVGASNFLGDLGGANQIGTNGVKDLEISLTRYVVGAGFRYRTSRYTGIKANLNYAVVNGNDALTSEPFRRNRNLHFKSMIAEFSVQFEGYITREQQGHLYKIRNVRGMRHKDIQIYGFAGIGGFYFNPKAQYVNGGWYSLQPLGTEGQGLKDGTKKYSRINIAIPMGIGFKYALDRQWGIGLELGMRKTFTDYIDDVSTNYFQDTTNTMSPMAAYFADPSLHDPKLTPVGGVEITSHGQQRGDPSDNDAYMFATVTINYKIPYRRTRSKF